MLIALTSMCAVTGTMVYAYSKLDSHAAFAAIPSPPSGRFLLSVTNFTQYSHGDSYFIAKTTNGNDIRFEGNYDGFTTITSNQLGLATGVSVYNDIFEDRALSNAITDITAIQVNYNENSGGALILKAGFGTCEDNHFYETEYIFEGDAKSTSIKSGFSFNFETQGGHYPNMFELEATADTIIESIYIAYACGLPIEQ